MKEASACDHQGSLQVFAKDWQMSLFDMTSSWLVSLTLLDRRIPQLLHFLHHYFTGFKYKLIFIFLDFPIYIYGCLIIVLHACIWDIFYNWHRNSASVFLQLHRSSISRTLLYAENVLQVQACITQLNLWSGDKSVSHCLAGSEAPGRLMLTHNLSFLFMGALIQLIDNILSGQKEVIQL